MIRALEKYIGENWTIFSRGVKPEHLSFLLVTIKQSKKYELGKIVYLIFRDGDPEPFLVAKMCRHRSYEHHLKNEVKNVETFFTHGQCDYIARPLQLVTIEDRLILFEEYVPGMSLKCTLNDLIQSDAHTEGQLRTMVRQHFLLAQGCIEKLNVSCTLEKTSALQQEIETLLTRHERTIGFPSNALAIAAEVRTLIPPASQGTPIRVTHYDFSPSNLKYDGKQCKIIDFEFSGMSTLLFLEPVRFVVYYFENLLKLNLFASQGYTIGLFEQVLYGKSWLTDIVDDFLERSIANYNPMNKRAYFYIFIMYDNLLQYDVVDYASDNFISFYKNRLELGIADYFNKVTGQLNAEITKQHQRFQDIYHSRGWKLAHFLHRVKKTFTQKKISKRQGTDLGK